MSDKPKYDVDVVRHAAEGRWKEIIPAKTGIPLDLLDSQHHPCPLCSDPGTDRFRAFDNFSRTGGLMCNQCIGKCGDGFEVLMKTGGKQFLEAVAEVAEYLGVKPKGTAQIKDPAKDLVFQPWNQQLANHFLSRKQGLTEAALIASGCQIAKYKKNYTVFAFPVIGNALEIDKPVGWALMEFNGAELPVWDRTGAIVRTTKVKLTSGSQPGLLNVHGIERLKTVGLVELVWKCEGVSDMLAMWGKIPEELRDRVIPLTTANGAEETPRWQASLMAACDTNIVHDADQPGQRGATKWLQAVALQQQGKVARNIELPYEIQEKHGKDLRDFFNEGRTYLDLEALATKATPKIIERNADGTLKNLTDLQYPLMDRIMEVLQIAVNEEHDDNSVDVFSMSLKKVSPISSTDRLSKRGMIHICGELAFEHISKEPDYENDVFDMEKVGDAIAYAACRRRLKFDRCGLGVWQGLDDQGAATGSIVLVNNAEAARYNGDQILRKVPMPECDGLALNFCDGHENFYDFDEMARNLENAKDPAWCTAAIDQCTDLFERWRWRNGVTTPTLVTGLVMSSYIQTIWEWRPLISITGESRSGKSYFFLAIGGDEHRVGLFGNLASRLSQSTEASIRIAVANNSRIPLIDEFEDGKARKSIMKQIFRLASRGDTVSRATSGQKKLDYRIRHIFWTAAIESGLEEQADANRFIHLELLAPEPTKRGKLVLPESGELRELGQRLLACSIKYAIAAKALAARLKSVQIEGIDPRTIECYAVPVAILAACQGKSDEEAIELLHAMASSVDRENQGTPDHEELLDTIMASRVHCGSQDGLMSVAQILEGATDGLLPQRYTAHRDKLEAEGVRLTDENDLFVYHKLVKRGLLRQTRWEGQRIDQLLLRLPDAKSKVQRLSGRVVRGIVIPKGLLKYVATDPFSGNGSEPIRSDDGHEDYASNGSVESL